MCWQSGVLGGKDDAACIADEIRSHAMESSPPPLLPGGPFDVCDIGLCFLSRLESVVGLCVGRALQEVDQRTTQFLGSSEWNESQHKVEGHTSFSTGQQFVFLGRQGTCGLVKCSVVSQDAGMKEESVARFVWTAKPQHPGGNGGFGELRALCRLRVAGRFPELWLSFLS